jgi:hypothetical protein
MKTLLAIAIAGLLLAATAANAESQPGCLKVEKIRAQHRTLQPGDTMNVEVRLKTSHCVLMNDYGAGKTATLFVEPQPGFESSVGPLDFLGLEGQMPYLDDSQAHVLQANIELKAGWVPSGEYEIPVFLNYQALDEQGVSKRESLLFTIPVAIVTSYNPPAAGHHRKWQNGFVIAGEVLLVILASPILILQCLLGNDCWTC